MCKWNIIYGICLPNCPKEYPYDIGIACLSNNKNLYLPNSTLCNYLNNNSGVLSGADPIIQGLVASCSNN